MVLKRFKEYKKELIGMAYNYKFNEEMASEIVEKMCPLGEYWDLSTTSSLKNDYGIVTDDYSFYIVMNSLNMSKKNTKIKASKHSKDYFGIFSEVKDSVKTKNFNLL